MTGITAWRTGSSSWITASSSTMANPRDWPRLSHSWEPSLSDREVVPSGEAAGMGRLSAAPHPGLFDLLYAPQFARDRQEVLPRLLRIDAAHVLMLAERGILPHETAAGLLRVNRELAARAQAGEPVIEPPPVHRGLYMVYESHYVD